MDKYTDEQLRAALERAQRDWDDLNTKSQVGATICNGAACNLNLTDDESLAMAMLGDLIGDIHREQNIRRISNRTKEYREWMITRLNQIPSL